MAVLRQVPSGSGLTSRLDWLSVAATPDSRRARDVRGQVLDVQFTIRDARSAAVNGSLGPYTVSVALQVRCLRCSHNQWLR